MSNIQWQENLALIEDLLWQEKAVHNLASIGGELQCAPTIDIGAFAPIGNIASSAEDVEKFIRLQFTSEGRNSPVLSSFTLQEMQTRILLDSEPQEITAIGWRPSIVNDTLVLAHGGADMAFVSYLAVVPSQKLGLFLATNTGINPERIAKIAREVIELILS